MPTPSDIAKLQKSVLLLSQAKEQEKTGSIATAVQLYQQAIRAYPLNPAGYEALMALLTRQDNTDNAELVLKAVPPALYAASKKLQFQHALVLSKQGHYDEAIALLEKLAGAPELDTARIWYIIGNCHNLRQRIDTALGFYHKAYAAGLRAAPFFKDWAGIHQQRGDVPAAEKMYAEAVKQFPDDEKLLYEYSSFLLKAERYEQGFALYQHRWQTIKPRPATPALPEWDGKTPVGALLVLQEQGIGDQLVYSALLPALLDKAEKVTAAFDLRLAPLLQRAYPGLDVATQNLSAADVAAHYDAYVTCADMGRFVPEAIGWQGGYLKPDAGRVARLQARYRQRFPGKQLIGLAWSSQRATYGEMKSINLLSWRPILENPACQFICLQYGEVEEELRKVRDTLGVEIYRDPDIDSFADLDGLAAQAHALDLVISTSNSTAHVAAATDAPTWVIVPMGQALLWYWGFRESATRWYPHVRLFRARAPAEWGPVMAAVADALSGYVEARS
ncbi:MAG: tetratricopeptide repeat protein [Pseudomonadota bacterium]